LSIAEREYLKKFKIQNSKFKMQNAEFKMQNYCVLFRGFPYRTGQK